MFLFRYLGEHFYISKHKYVCLQILMSVLPSQTSVAMADVSTWSVASVATVTRATPQDQMKSVKVIYLDPLVCGVGCHCF